MQATNSLDDDVQADRLQQQFLNDALGSAAVIVAAIVVATTGWTRADAIVSLLIGALILPRAWILLRDSGRVLLEATPAGLDLDAVRQHILEGPHVRDVHDLHASQIATGLPTLSAHVVLDEECFHDGTSLPCLIDRRVVSLIPYQHRALDVSVRAEQPPRPRGDPASFRSSPSASARPALDQDRT